MLSDCGLLYVKACIYLIQPRQHQITPFLTHRVLCSTALARLVNRKDDPAVLRAAQAQNSGILREVDETALQATSHRFKVAELLVDTLTVASETTPPCR